VKSGPRPARTIEISIDGEVYRGQYVGRAGVVTVSYAGHRKSAHVGQSSASEIATVLLHQLVADWLAALV
jgi:hypothetical protein